MNNKPEIAIIESNTLDLPWTKKYIGRDYSNGNDSYLP